MELLSIVQICDKSNIPEPSIRRYIAKFKEALPKGVKMGRGVKYPPEIVQRLKDISLWYQRGKSKEEIRENLELGKTVKVSSSGQSKDRFEVLTDEIRILNETIKVQTEALGSLTNLVSQAIPPHAQLLSGLAEIQKQITSVSTASSESPTQPPHPQLDKKAKTSPTEGLKSDKNFERPEGEETETQKSEKIDQSRDESVTVITKPSSEKPSISEDLSDDDLGMAVPKKYRGSIADISVRQAQDYFPNHVIASAIKYTDTMGEYDSPGRFFDMMKNVLREGLHLKQDPEPVKEIPETEVPAEMKTDSPSAGTMDPEPGGQEEPEAPEPVPPKPEVGKMAELNIGQRMEVVDAALQATEVDEEVGADEMVLSDPELYRALDKAPHSESADATETPAMAPEPMEQGETTEAAEPQDSHDDHMKEPLEFEEEAQPLDEPDDDSVTETESQEEPVAEVLESEREPKDDAVSEKTEVPTEKEERYKQRIESEQKKEYPDKQLEFDLRPKEFNKDKITQIIVDLHDKNGLGWSAIARELKTMGYRPKSGKLNFPPSTVSIYYKEWKKKSAEEVPPAAAPVDFEDEPGQAADPKPEVEAVPDADLGGPEVVVPEKSVPESAEETAAEQGQDPEDKKKIDEQDLDIFSKEPIPKLTLPNCRGKKLTVEERDRYVLRTEDMFPGKGNNQQRAEALNKAGIRTGRGRKWDAKAVTNNLYFAKKRAEKS